MSFLKHKVSVFGVDLDRGKKRQKVREGPLTCFATFAVIHSIALWSYFYCISVTVYLHLPANTNTKKRRHVWPELSFAVLHFISCKFFPGIAWQLEHSLWIGNLNIPRSSICKWQIVQSFRHCKWYSEYKLNLILFVKWSFCKSAARIQARFWEKTKSWYHIIISDNILN